MTLDLFGRRSVWAPVVAGHGLEYRGAVRRRGPRSYPKGRSRTYRGVKECVRRSSTCGKAVAVGRWYRVDLPAQSSAGDLRLQHSVGVDANPGAAHVFVRALAAVRPRSRSSAGRADCGRLAAVGALILAVVSSWAFSH